MSYKKSEEKTFESVNFMQKIKSWKKFIYCNQYRDTERKNRHHSCFFICQTCCAM